MFFNLLKIPSIFIGLFRLIAFSKLYYLRKPISSFSEILKQDTHTHITFLAIGLLSSEHKPHIPVSLIFFFLFISLLVKYIDFILEVFVTFLFYIVFFFDIS